MKNLGKVIVDCWLHVRYLIIDFSCYLNKFIYMRKKRRGEFKKKKKSLGGNWDFYGHWWIEFKWCERVDFSECLLILVDTDRHHVHLSVSACFCWWPCERSPLFFYFDSVYMLVRCVNVRLCLDVVSLRGITISLFIVANEKKKSLLLRS